MLVVSLHRPASSDLTSSYCQRFQLLSISSTMDFYETVFGLLGKKYPLPQLGPSIYDVHTEGEGGQAQVDGVKGSSSMWTFTQKIKIRVHCLLLMQTSWRLF